MQFILKLFGLDKKTPTEIESIDFESSYKLEIIETPLLIEEETIVEMKDGLSGSIKNNPQGFYECDNCFKSFRYKKDSPFPHELECPNCQSMISHYGLYFFDNGEVRNNSTIRSEIENEIEKLQDLYDNSKSYHPLLCEYAQYFFKHKDYEKAIEVGFNIHNRWASESDRPGTMPLDIVGKSFRARAKQKKKDGAFESAIDDFEKLIEIDRATDNDKKLLAQLKEKLAQN